jgi:hypothetical protein
MNTCKRNKIIYTATGLLICFLLSMVSTALQAAAGGELMLSLQPELDGKGAVKVTSITKAELTGPDGTIMINGDVSGGSARFNLSGIDAGDYFIRVNDLDDDLVPTRIDDVATTIDQFVGQKLRVTVIGNLSDPTYRIQTFSKGQGEHPVVVYSDGSNEIPEQYAYVLLSLKTSPQELEINVIGTSYQLNSYSPITLIHPSTYTAFNPTFSNWMLGENNHANDYNGIDSKCNTCHVNMDTKPANFTKITTSNGWCYRCHYGKEGVVNGFIDTTALSAPLPIVTSTSVATIAAPTATPKIPEFEALMAISALLITVLVRRR